MGHNVSCHFRASENDAQQRVDPGTFWGCDRSLLRHQKENVMNSIIWLVGAVVIVIAVLNLVGFA